ncbi:MaoC/PaaZ C-terminal domain-containing protein [Streptomyces sp. NBC_01363]|uniref:MaoC/PaaZ C-terminal domain-containing protein n=1 Tax=Streptomyces sp. NBC_01363 TaxID=2903840 RepID=UPI0022508C14|nr:MaoC/PaaZ C-terminal domain-containing protein [Streptomyces sp. NBC_01363]MCX4734106.1 MaoC/PaaZ C-terminal domain-containing protein [Streptomyces sp. NBC_01363]
MGTIRFTEAEMIRFAEQFDPQPYHLGGGDSLFGGLVASGWHRASAFMRRYVDVVLDDSAAEGSPGVDQLRWLLPVRPGERLTASITVAGSSISLTRPDCGTVHNHCELVRGDGQEVMTMTLHAMFCKRPATN